ncbi:MAG TPA: hypothetical protein VJT67_09100 [Longimicrobiaceae bacterium]|nr:hypothetical protein [Longimicrobiaceae bacterium]
MGEQSGTATGTVALTVDSATPSGAEQVQLQGGDFVPLWVAPQNAAVGTSYGDGRSLFSVVGTPPGDSLDGGSHLMFGDASASSGTTSATLTFAGWTVVHGGMYWTPASSADGTLTLTCGGSDSPPANPAYFTFGMGSAGGTLSMPQLPNLPGSGSTADLVVSSSGTIEVSTSSARFKDEVQPLQGDFSRMLELEPKAYTRRDTGDRGIGYLAEDLDALGLRDLVGYDPAGRPLTVDYKRLPVYLLELVKELRRSVDELRGQLRPVPA